MAKKIKEAEDNSESNLFELSQTEKDIQLETIYKCMLPKLSNNFSELIAAHILLILKLEGVIGDTLKPSDVEMIEGIKEKIFKDKSMHKEFLKIVKSLKGGAK